MISLLIMTIKGVLILIAAVWAFSKLLKEEDARWVRGAPLYIFPGLFFIGFWGHTVWVAYLAVSLAIPIFAKSRADAAAIFAIVIVAMPDMIYQSNVGSIYLFSIGKSTFASLGLVIAFFTKRQTDAKSGFHFDLPILLLLALSIFSGRDPKITETIRHALPSLIDLAVPYFLISRSLKSREDLRRFVLALALAAFVMAVVAFFEQRLHWLLYKEIENRLHIATGLSAYKSRGGSLRATAAFPDQLSLGVYLAFGTIAIMAFRASFATRRNYYLALLVMAIGLTAPNSRGALLGVVLGWLAFDFFRKRYSRLAAELGVIGMAYLVLLALANISPYVAGVLGHGADASSTSQYRIELLTRGMEEIRKHPLLGTTLSTALNNLDDMRQGEGIIDMVNGYISYGLTAGYIGIIVLAMVFLSMMIAMLRVRRNLSFNDSADRALDFAACVFAIAGLSLVTTAFGGFGGRGAIPFCEIYAIGSVIWALRKSRSADRPIMQQQLGQLSSKPSIQSLIHADRARVKASGQM